MFLADEWEEFGIADLQEDDYIKSNVSYFKPLSHDVRKLAEDSPCDNVLLEYNLALELDDVVVYWYSFSNHYTKRAFTQP